MPNGSVSEEYDVSKGRSSIAYRRLPRKRPMVFVFTD
jgi:hypothetical protein